MGRPKTYDDKLRNRLLDEAAEMLHADGYRSVSLRTITNRADTSTNAVYTLFGSKEALIAEAILRDLDEKLKPVIEAQDIADPETAMITVTRRLRDFANQNPRLFMGAFDAMAEARESTSLTGRLNPDVKKLDKQLFSPILRVCKRVAEQHPKSVMTPERMGMTLWASLHGFIVLEVSDILPVEGQISDEVFDELVYSLYAGWTSRDLGELAKRHKRNRS